MIKMIFIAVALLLGGCSMLDVLNVVKPSKGIEVDTEIVVGDKREQIETTVAAKRETTNTTNTADTITQSYTTIQPSKTISEIAFMMLVAFLVGWLAMPSTRQMFLMVRKLFKKP